MVSTKVLSTELSPEMHFEDGKYKNADTKMQDTKMQVVYSVLRGSLFKLIKDITSQSTHAELRT